MSDRLTDEQVAALRNPKGTISHSFIMALAREVQDLRAEIARRDAIEAEFNLSDGRTVADELRITRAYHAEADFPGHLIKAGHRILELRARVAELGIALADETSEGTL